MRRLATSRLTTPEPAIYVVWFVWAISWMLAALWSSRPAKRVNVLPELGYRIGEHDARGDLVQRLADARILRSSRALILNLSSQLALHLIQGAQHLLHNLTFLERWPDTDRRSKIVFITQGFDRAEVEDMIGLLDRVATRTAAARARAQAQSVANE